MIVDKISGDKRRKWLTVGVIVFLERILGRARLNSQQGVLCHTSVSELKPLQERFDEQSHVTTADLIPESTVPYFSITSKYEIVSYASIGKVFLIKLKVQS